jgi:hypothetical protein
MATKTKSTKKPAAKRSTKAKGKAVKAAKKPAAKAKPAAKGAPREGTKTAQLLALLAGKGASNAELCEALGWQPHTLRAAVSRLPATSSGRALTASPATGSRANPDTLPDVHRQRWPRRSASLRGNRSDRSVRR